jgi:hypothetical protein
LLQAGGQTSSDAVMATDRPRKRISPGEGYDAGDRPDQTGVRAVLPDRIRLTGQNDKIMVGLCDHTSTAIFAPRATTRSMAINKHSTDSVLDGVENRACV